LISRATAEFWELRHGLPQNARKSARAAYAQFEINPRHPSLQFKCVDQALGLWSDRLSRSYRVLGLRDNDEIVWFWIGPHAEYDQMLGRH
jgi:hypothetical protein